MFVDGPKDSRFEPSFVPRLLPVVKKTAVVIFDDVRLLPMVALRQSVSMPKMDHDRESALG